MLNKMDIKEDCRFLVDVESNPNIARGCGAIMSNRRKVTQKS